MGSKFTVAISVEKIGGGTAAHRRPIAWSSSSGRGNPKETRANAWQALRVATAEIELSVEDRIATVTLTRPHAAHGINRASVTQLRGHAESLRDRDEVRVAVLRSTGRSFCVGGDLQYFSGLDP